MPEVISAQVLTYETNEEATEDSIDDLMETSLDSEKSQGSVYSDGDDSEADDDSNKNSILIEDTEFAAMNSGASQGFRRVERSVESDDAYSVLLRASLANSIANPRRKCVIFHDVSLEDFFEPETEMI